MQTSRPILLLILLCLAAVARGQRFYNLTSEQVSIDSTLPRCAYSFPLEGQWADSTYTCSILYPEFIDVTPADAQRARMLAGEALPALPVVESAIAVDRKKASLEARFSPLVLRDGRYQLLVSFMLRVDAAARATVQGARAKVVTRAASTATRAASTTTRAASTAERYADHSVLRSGRWVKLRVPATGLYRITPEWVRRAGFTDLSKVKIYGYGGNLQPEKLDGTYLQSHDDLMEVPTCWLNGSKVFYGLGTVSWESETSTRRTRNPYSDYGYYFVTQSDEAPLEVDSATLRQSYATSPFYHHTLVENDGYSWYEGGRNLFDPQATAVGEKRAVVLKSPALTAPQKGILSVCVTSGTDATIEVQRRGQRLGTLNIRLGEYDKGGQAIGTYNVADLAPTDTVTIVPTAGGPIRLDYVSAASQSQLQPLPVFSDALPTPELLYAITPQDHHADAQADMVIIIPTSQQWRAQAQRLADFHQSHDGLRVNIVPADELFNEFASGTPDANAYRRYLKMLYDRAANENDMPRYLLLMGDCVWDNRMLTEGNRLRNPDDYLLAFESENSFSEIECYVDDSFYGLLDDGEGTNPLSSDKIDVAVGRFPVNSVDEAKVMVDKVIDYATNTHAGAWQNTLVFMGDDGDNNLHMHDLNDAAESVMRAYPAYRAKKVMWDAYQGVSTPAGNSYPEVTAVVKKLQQEGALIMDYAGHGRPNQISHERVLMLSDVDAFSNTNLPLWVTASCDILPFDGTVPTIGESLVLNSKGGAVAIFGTTRTVYSNYNKAINMAFLRRVLSRPKGKAITMGEAMRQAKNQMIDNRQDLTCNKIQYSLLGDPALALRLPEATVVLDSINGHAVGSAVADTLKAGSKVRLAGHVEGWNELNGRVTLTLRDVDQLITCHQNASAQSDTAFTFHDRPVVLFEGVDSLRQGHFAFSFTLPIDISYAGATGLMNFYAVTADRQQTANGRFDNFVVGGSDIQDNDGNGPKIYCYLNTDEFVDGQTVNATPFFVARVSDADGINLTGASIGHDLRLVVDNNTAMSYVLNDNFSYDNDSHTAGQTWMKLPQLEPGEHSLTFTAWDIYNNSSTSTLHFNVDYTTRPAINSLSMTNNPCTTSTTFVVAHSFEGNAVDITIDVMSMQGQLLWQHREQGATTQGAYTYAWDLTTNSGTSLGTGVYLYRVSISANGSEASSETKKFVVLRNN